MNKLITLIAAITISLAQAQTASFTLDQCVQYALENNINVQNAVLDERAASARVKEVMGMGLPQVNGTVTLMHNEKLSRFFSQYKANAPAGFLDLSAIPGIEDGDVVAFQNFFQLKSNGSAGIGANQLVFNGSYFVGLQASKSLKELSSKQTNRSKEEVVDQVTKAFYLTLVNRERIQLFDNNINRLDTLVRNTKALNANGFAESIDVDRLQVTLNNLITEKEKFINLQALSVELLKFQMNYPMGQTLEIVGDITSITPSTEVSTYSADWDYSQRPDYQVMEVNRKLQELNIKNFKATGLPTVSLFGNYGYSTQSPNIGGIFVTNSSIQENKTAGYGPDKWYPNFSYGLQMNIPIFAGFQLKYKVQQEKINLLKIENGIKQLRSSIDIEIKNALAAYQNAIKTMQSQKANMDLSAKVARVTKIKYEQGVGSNIEILDAENSLKESQVNYYNALYDALVAKVDLDKAYGKLLPQNQTN